MVKLAIAGLAGALVGGLSTWVLLPEPTPPSERDEQARGESAEEPSPAVSGARARRRGQGPETLPECERALEARESQLEKVRATAARAVAQRAAAAPAAPRPFPDGDDLPGPGPAHGAEPGAGQTGPAAPASPEAQAAADRAAADRIDEALLAELHVTEEERQITREVMCPRQDNQRALVFDFAEGRVDTEALLRSLAQERSTANEAMRRSLGAARFRELRGVGGMGILVRRVCSRP